MSNEEIVIPEPDEIDLVPSGNVKQVVTSGINTQFETSVERTQGQINEMTLASLKRGLKFRTVDGGGQVRRGC